jgi:antitoxin (DNA-binding transcriptional repressor) of toxin-antitoxin stability system
MTTFEIANPDSQLSALLERIARGEDIVLTQNGHELARVHPVKQNVKPKRIGFLEGKIQIQDDFDKTPQDIIDSFYEPIFPQEKT